MTHFFSAQKYIILRDSHVSRGNYRQNDFHARLGIWQKQKPSDQFVIENHSVID